MLSFEISHIPERVRNQVLIKTEQWNFWNVKKLNLFCNFWSSKYCLRNCNATISVCEKMFKLNGFLWFFASTSALWLPSLKNLQGLMVIFENLVASALTKVSKTQWIPITPISENLLSAAETWIIAKENRPDLITQFSQGQTLL